MRARWCRCGWLLSRGGRSSPANASGCDTHRDSITARISGAAWQVLSARGPEHGAEALAELRHAAELAPSNPTVRRAAPHPTSTTPWGAALQGVMYQAPRPKLDPGGRDGCRVWLLCGGGGGQVLVELALALWRHDRSSPSPSPSPSPSSASASSLSSASSASASSASSAYLSSPAKRGGTAELDSTLARALKAAEPPKGVRQLT
jgi:hypothetical protein